MSFAALDRIAKKILENLPDCEGIERGVLEKIAETSKAQLCQLLKELTEIAKHRQDPLHTNALYDQINNPRKQLKFLEEYAKKASSRREVMAKEALTKGGKRKKLSKKATRELSNANLEERKQRDADAAAILALGGSRNVPTFENVQYKNPIRNITNIQPRRVPITITMRDLQCALNCMNIYGGTVLAMKIAYGYFKQQEQNTVENR